MKRKWRRLLKAVFLSPLVTMVASPLYTLVLLFWVSDWAFPSTDVWNDSGQMAVAVAAYALLGSLVMVLLLGVPLHLVADRYWRGRYWPYLVVGLIPGVIWTAAEGANPVTSVPAVLFGGIAASVFWYFASYSSASNNALERSRGAAS